MLLSQYLRNRPIVGRPSMVDANVAPPNSAGHSEMLPLAGRCSDHKQGISPFVRRCGAVSDPRAPAAFPSREERRSSAEDGGDMAQETVVAILSTTPPRVTRFRKPPARCREALRKRRPAPEQQPAHVQRCSGPVRTVRVPKLRPDPSDGSRNQYRVLGLDAKPATTLASGPRAQGRCHLSAEHDAVSADTGRRNSPLLSPGIG